MAGKNKNDVKADGVGFDGIYIDDDYTDAIYDSQKKYTKTASKSAKATVGESTAISNEKSKGPIKSIVTNPYLVGMAIYNTRTGMMEKSHRKMSESYKKDRMEHNLHVDMHKQPGNNDVVGHAFSMAMERILLEQKMKKMEALEKRFQKRKARMQKLEKMLSGSIDAISMASRTAGEQNTMNRLTSRTSDAHNVKSSDYGTSGSDSPEL